MFCPRCGSARIQGAAFCEKCGERLGLSGSGATVAYGYAPTMVAVPHHQTVIAPVRNRLALAGGWVALLVFVLASVMMQFVQGTYFAIGLAAVMLGCAVGAMFAFYAALNETGIVAPGSYLEFCLLALPYLTLGLQRMTLSIVIPSVMQEFGSSYSYVSLVFTVFTVCLLIGAPIAGLLVDQFSPRWVALGAITICALGELICGMAPNLIAIVIGRGLMAFGIAAVLPVAAKAAMLLLPGSNWPFAIAFMLLMNYVSSVITPLVMVPLMSGRGWRVTLMIMAGIAALSAIPILLVYSNRQKDEPPSPAPVISIAGPLVVYLVGALLLGHLYTGGYRYFSEMLQSSSAGSAMSLVAMFLLAGVLAGLAIVITAQISSNSVKASFAFRSSTLAAAALALLGSVMLLTRHAVVSKVAISIMAVGIGVAMVASLTSALHAVPRATAGLMIGVFSCLSTLVGFAFTYAGQLAGGTFAPLAVVLSIVLAVGAILIQDNTHPQWSPQ